MNGGLTHPPRAPSCACGSRVRLSPALTMLLLPLLAAAGGIVAAVIVAVARGG